MKLVKYKYSVKEVFMINCSHLSFWSLSLNSSLMQYLNHCTGEILWFSLNVEIEKGLLERKGEATFSMLHNGKFILAYYDSTDVIAQTLLLVFPFRSEILPPPERQMSAAGEWWRFPETVYKDKDNLVNLQITFWKNVSTFIQWRWCSPSTLKCCKIFFCFAIMEW